MSNVEELLTAMINGGDVSNWECQSRVEEYLKKICLGESCADMDPQSRIEYLLKELSMSGMSGGSSGQYNIEVIHNDDGTQILNITDKDFKAPEFDRVFANNTPAQIARVSEIIKENNYTSDQIKQVFGWDIDKDTIIIPTATGENVEVGFLGFNHDDLSDGSGKAGITFGMRNCLLTPYPLNTDNTNAGGIFESDFVINYMDTLFSLLPEEWQAVIKPVDKKAANGGNTNFTGIVTQSCKLFFQSEVEVFGTATRSQNGYEEGEQYEYWIGKPEDAYSKTYDANGDGQVEEYFWWLRSCCAAAETHFCCAIYAPSQARSSFPLGVSLAFCV